MRNRFYMDNIGSTNFHYKNIYNISLGIVLLLLQAYLMLIFSGIDCFSFEHVQNSVTRYLLQLLLQILIFTFSYIIVYFIVEKIYILNWISKHKSIWLQGTWLHIHVNKNTQEIRIGFVEIYQNFLTIKARGTNFYPEGCGKDKQRETTWDYVIGKIFEDEHKRDFIGVYEAKDKFSLVPRNGIHSLTIERGNDGFPCKMVGKFGDTVELDNFSQSISSTAGQLYFFKPSSKCKEYIFSGDRNKRIFDLHTIEDFNSEPYVYQLNTIINQTNKANQ